MSPTEAMCSVENRFPYNAAIGGLPDASARRPDVIHRRISGNARDSRDASGAIRADKSPAHGIEKIGVNLLRAQWRRCGRHQKRNADRENCGGKKETAKIAHDGVAPFLHRRL